MGSNGVCNTGLVLGLGSFHQYSPTDHHDHRTLRSDDDLDQENKKKILWLKYDHLLPSLSLGPSSDDHHHVDQAYHQTTEISAHDLHGRPASSLSAVSSFSNSSSTVKRDRDRGGGGGGGGGGCEEVEVEVELERFSGSRVSNNEEDEDHEGSPRKKLRLTKEQSAVLEDSFKEHTTLNPKQKLELAKQLNLRPRQVEVWFQNRRARTKLKQTEADYELLKKCCETLTEENKRLQKELQELKSLKVTAPFLLQFPSTSATLTICPSCERICGNGADGSSSTTSFLKIGPTKPHNFSNPFGTPTTHPSAAC